MLRKLLRAGPRYHWKKVVLIVVFSSICFSGGTAAALLFYCYVKHLHATNDTSVIQAVIQTSGQYAPLQTTYLAEVLELSRDKPINLSQLDLKAAHERLLATHVIQEALLKKIKPNYLYIDYQIRQPVAFLGDYTNTALDREGKFFPFLPFYSPRKLPEVYLGTSAHSNPWGANLEPKQLCLAIDILGHFKEGEVKRLDLSQIEDPSAGRRQIVVVLEKGLILRLSLKNYPQELTYYFMLDGQMIEKASVIDLRNPQVAYISYGK